MKDTYIALMTAIISLAVLGVTLTLSTCAVKVREIEYKHKDIEAVRCLNKIPQRRGKR